MNRLLALSLALAIFGAGFSSAQPLLQAETPASSGVLVQGGSDGQTVDEGTLLERRLAASGRTHGSYRAPRSNGSTRHHGRATRGQRAHGSASHSHAHHHSAPVHHRRR